MKRLEIFEVWRRGGKSTGNQLVLKYILQQFNMTNLEKTPRVLQMFVSSLCSKIATKWEKSKRKINVFLAEHRDWLYVDITFPNEFVTMLPSSTASRDESRSDLGEGSSRSIRDINISKVGRPTKDFEECSLKVQKRKLKDLVDCKSKEELTLAAEMSLRSSGKRDAAHIVRELSLSSPRRATTIKKARKLFLAPKPELTPEAALGLMVDAKLSVYQYNTMREQAKSVKSNLYPSYKKVQDAKKYCYPPEDAITVTQYSAEVKLQAILDLTARRICLLQQEVLERQVDSSSGVTLQLISKWGCDGISAQSRYNQSLSVEFSDEHLFSITFVPLRLIDDQTNVVLWHNPRPNSTRMCRLIRFSCQKETKDVIRNESNLMKNQIKNLVPTKIKINDTEVDCRHHLLQTMVDGKVCSTLSQYDSSQKCYICGATPKNMNEESQARTSDEEMYAFGISPLHAWIRSFECFLHISYKLDIKKWRATTDEDKQSVAMKKAEIQEKFRTEMGMLVDMPKQSTGNTNTGNTARAFFRNSEKSACITKLNQDLISRFCAILEALACDYEIDADKFEKFTQETKAVYLKHYSWYPMPATIHKILIHAKDIIKTCILPLGQLAEEAQEASNKEYRRIRENFSRKTSRIDTNTDILNRFLVSSDPLLSSRTIMKSRNRHSLPKDTINMLKSSSVSADESDDD